jgi:hypothetical protein
MATIKPNMNIRVGVNPGEDDGSLILVTWTNLNTANSVGSAVCLPQHSDRSIQFSGTFNNVTAVLEGSNDGVNFNTLTDASGVALSVTSKSLKQVLEAPLWVRPNVNTNAGVNTDLSATLFLRRNGRLTR